MEMKKQYTYPDIEIELFISEEDILTKSSKPVPDESALENTGGDYTGGPGNWEF